MQLGYITLSSTHSCLIAKWFCPTYTVSQSQTNPCLTLPHLTWVGNKSNVETQQSCNLPLCVNVKCILMFHMNARKSKMVQFSTPKDFLAVAVGLIEKGRPRERERWVELLLKFFFWEENSNLVKLNRTKVVFIKGEQWKTPTLWHMHDVTFNSWALHTVYPKLI